MIKLIDILNENQYEPGKKIGAGLGGDVFSVKNYPEYVYKPITKKIYGQITKEQVKGVQEYIQKRPDIFAQIIYINDNYYIQERVNVLKFKQDLRKLNQDFKKTIGNYYYQWYAEDNDDGTPETRALYGAINLNYYPEIENQVNLENLTDDSKKLILKIKQFFEKGKDVDFDTHSNNFGYDSKDNIKYFDFGV